MTSKSKGASTDAKKLVKHYECLGIKRGVSKGKGIDINQIKIRNQKVKGQKRHGGKKNM